MTRTLDIPKLFSTTSRGVTVSVETAKLSDVILVSMLMSCQVVMDAASGAQKDAAVGMDMATAETYAVWAKTEAAKTWSMSEAGRMAIAESTKRLMEKKVAALEAGDWQARNESSGIPTETRLARSLMRGMMKAKADSKAWAVFTGLSDADQNAKIDANIAKNAEAMAVKVAAEIARLEALRAAKAKIADGLDIAL